MDREGMRANSCGSCPDLRAADVHLRGLLLIIDSYDSLGQKRR